MKNNGGCIGLMFKGVILLLLMMAWAWGCLALFFSGPDLSLLVSGIDPEWLKLMLVCLFAFSLPVILIMSRSFTGGVFLSLCIFGALLFWWQSLEPTNNKDWAADVARISHGEIQGNTLTMHNVRNFRYSDEKISDERWETRTYDLTNLQGLDLFLSYWDSDHIAHTILSWNFGTDQHLAISIETRKDKTQEYSAIKGFFKQFGLSYVAADEKDIIMLRTNYRKEKVYIYPLNVSKEKARALLEDYLAEMNLLVNKPQFYNALTRNCTTTIHLHTNAIAPPDAPPVPSDWRLIASGHLDELLYEKGIVAQHLPFTELRKKSRVDQRMRNYDKDHFSRILRFNIPAFAGK